MNMQKIFNTVRATFTDCITDWVYATGDAPEYVVVHKETIDTGEEARLLGQRVLSELGATNIVPIVMTDNGETIAQFTLGGTTLHLFLYTSYEGPNDGCYAGVGICKEMI